MKNLVSIMFFCAGTVSCITYSSYISQSIYKTGEELTSCEANFRNLFNNWNSKNITNADDFTMVSYAFVETVSDTSITDMSAKFIDSKTLVASMSSRSHTVIDNEPYLEQIINVRTVESMFDTAGRKPDEAAYMLKMLEQDVESRRNYFKHAVVSGDKVYSVFFRYKKQDCSVYVVCSGERNEVVYDLVFISLNVETRKSGTKSIF